MTAERLHFMVESPANFVRLACTILFEKKKRSNGRMGCHMA
jgi:hypothetical protein